MRTSSLLSELGVPYDDCSSASDIDRRLNDAITIIGAAVAGTYRTPGFVQQPITSAAFDPANAAGMAASMISVQAAIQTGHLDTVHAAVDVLNGWRLKGDGAEYVPPSDLDILNWSQSSAGQLLRRLRGAQFSPLILSDPAKANSLVQDAESAVPPPQPPPAALVIAAPAGLLLASGTVIPAPDGSKWTFFATPFGNILVRAA